MISSTTPEFWENFHALPREIQELARRNYLIWLANPQHPSIRFKRIKGDLYSARVGRNYRTVGYLEGGEIIWTWIGKHDVYDRLI